MEKKILKNIKKINFKVVLVATTIVLLIISTFIITIFQNHYIFQKTSRDKVHLVQIQARKRFNDKLVMLSNLMFFKVKYAWDSGTSTDLLRFSKRTNTLNLLNIFDKILKKNVNHKSVFGKNNVFLFKWDKNPWRWWWNSDKVKIVKPGEKGHFGFTKYVENDIKRFYFGKLREWINLINEGSEENINQLKGFVKNNENSNEIEKIFLIVDEFFNNEKIRLFFANPKNNERIQAINFDIIINFWKFWSQTLESFYQELPQLKNSLVTERKWLKKHMLLNNGYTVNQINDLTAKIDDHTISLEKIFEQFIFYDGKNIADTVAGEIRKVTDFSDVDWWKILIQSINKDSINKILNTVKTLYLKYLFNEIKNPYSKHEIKITTKLNGVVEDFLIFVKDGLFAQTQKFNELIKGFQSGIPNILTSLGNIDDKLNNLNIQNVENILSNSNKDYLFKIIWKNTKDWRKKIVTQSAEFVALLPNIKIFGNFEINRLKHIFDNPVTINNLRTRIDSIKAAINDVSQKATAGGIPYKKSLIEIIKESNKLFAYLISKDILNPDSNKKIDSNLNFWTFLSLTFLKQKNPAYWNKVNEIIKIVFNNFNNEEILDIVNISLSLIDDFTNVTSQFIEWKDEKMRNSLLTNDNTRDKIFELIEKNDLVSKILDKLLIIKKKYEAQIIATSIEGENFFAEWNEKLWNKIKIKNWFYDVKVVDGWHPTNNEHLKIYTFKIKSSPTKEENIIYHYEIIWWINDDNNIELKTMRELETLTK